MSAKKKNIKRSTAAKNTTVAQTAKKPLTRAEMVYAQRRTKEENNAKLVTPDVKRPAGNTATSKMSRADMVYAQRKNKATGNAAPKQTPTAAKSGVKAKKTPVQKKKNVAPVKRKATKTINKTNQIDRALKAQTPKSRQGQRQVKHINGSVKKLEVKRRSNNSKQSFRIKKKKSKINKALVYRFVIFLVMFALFFGVFAIFFSVNLNSGKIFKGEAYTLQLGQTPATDERGYYIDENAVEPVYEEIPASCATRNGINYIPVGALNTLCDLTVTGTASDLRYITTAAQPQSISFYADSDEAYVNGVLVRLEGEAFIAGGVMYAPLNFFTEYCQGLIFELDEAEHKITVSRQLIGIDPETKEEVYADVSFKAAVMPEYIPLEESEELGSIIDTNEDDEGYDEYDEDYNEYDD